MAKTMPETRRFFVAGELAWPSRSRFFTEALDVDNPVITLGVKIRNARHLAIVMALIQAAGGLVARQRRGFDDQQTAGVGRAGPAQKPIGAVNGFLKPANLLF